MLIAVPKEIKTETRVAVTPDIVKNINIWGLKSACKAVRAKRPALATRITGKPVQTSNRQPKTPIKSHSHFQNLGTGTV